MHPNPHSVTPSPSIKASIANEEAQKWGMGTRFVSGVFQRGTVCAYEYKCFTEKQECTSALSYNALPSDSRGSPLYTMLGRTIATGIDGEADSSIRRSGTSTIIVSVQQNTAPSRHHCQETYVLRAKAHCLHAGNNKQVLTMHVVHVVLSDDLSAGIA